MTLRASSTALSASQVAALADLTPTIQATLYDVYRTAGHVVDSGDASITLTEETGTLPEPPYGVATFIKAVGSSTNERLTTLYVNRAGSDMTIVPSIGHTGYGILLYQTDASAQSSNIIIDCSGFSSTIYLNGVLQPGYTTTLYSGDRGHLYQLISAEDGDSYDIREIGRSLTAQQFVPTNGSTNTCRDCIGFAVMKPAGIIAGATLVYPPHPQDGDEFRFTSTQTITTLTNSSGSNSRVGAPTTLAANAYATMKYSLSDTTWYRIA